MQIISAIILQGYWAYLFKLFFPYCHIYIYTHSLTSLYMHTFIQVYYIMLGINSDPRARAITITTMTQVGIVWGESNKQPNIRKRSTLPQHNYISMKDAQRLEESLTREEFLANWGSVVTLHYHHHHHHIKAFIAIHIASFSLKRTAILKCRKAICTTLLV